jgi:hypothetical protein
MALKAPSSGGNSLSILNIAGTTIIFTYDKTTQSTLSGHPLKENFQITIENKIHNSSLQTHYDEYLTNAVVEPVEVVLEDNSKDTIITGLETAVPFVYIWCNGQVDAKREVAYGVGVYSGDTGNATAVPGGIGDFPVTIQGINMLDAGITTDLTILGALVGAITNSAGNKYMLAATTLVIDTDKPYGEVKWLTPGAVIE